LDLGDLLFGALLYYNLNKLEKSHILQLLALAIKKYKMMIIEWIGGKLGKFEKLGY